MKAQLPDQEVGTRQHLLCPIGCECSLFRCPLHAALPIRVGFAYVGNRRALRWAYFWVQLAERFAPLGTDRCSFLIQHLFLSVRLITTSSNFLFSSGCASRTKVFFCLAALGDQPRRHFLQLGQILLDMLHVGLHSRRTGRDVTLERGSPPCGRPP